MVGNSMNSENMPWQYPQKSTNLGKSAWVAGLIRVYSGLNQGILRGLLRGLLRIQGFTQVGNPRKPPR